MDISNFAAKWVFFTDAGRAQAISRTYFPNAKSTAKERVAEKFPRDAAAPFPVADEAARSMKATSFWGWLADNRLPKAREASFAALTSLDLAVWEQPLAEFEIGIRRLNGELPTWKELVQRARLGAIKVIVDDPGPVTRFTIKGATGNAPESQQAWVGCEAWVELPAATMSEADSWRAWLIAEYAEDIFVLDPRRGDSGEPSLTSMTQATKILPRGWTLGIPEHFAPGRTFDTVVLAINLGDQGAAVVDAFEQLERRLVDATDDLYSRARQRRIRTSLDDAAGLIGNHGIEKRVYRQPCNIVHRAGSRHPDLRQAPLT